MIIILKKTNEYYSRIKEIILSGYSKLYSFLTIAGSDIEEYIDKKNNQYINELQEKIAIGISRLEYIKQYVFYLTNFQGNFAIFNSKYKDTLDKYSLRKDLNPVLINNVMLDFYKTISNCESKNFPQQSKYEYYAECVSILDSFYRLYSSITSQMSPSDEASLLEDFGNDKQDKEKLKFKNIKWKTQYLTEVLDTEFYNKKDYCNDNNEFNDLFKYKKENSKIDCSELLKYFTNNISQKVVQTIQSIARDVLNNMPKNYSELYDILNSNINNFVSKIELITDTLLDFLTNELINNKEIKSNVIASAILPHIRDNLINFKEKMDNIKKHKENTKKKLIKAGKYK